MKIVVLCGGRGKRLGELTDSNPKPLIKLKDKTILEIKINEYLKQGFDDFVFCTGYKADLIEKAVKSFDLKFSYTFSNAGENAGMLERIYKAKECLGDLIIVTYGDTYTNLNLKELKETHLKSDNEATIVVAPIRNPFGLVAFDGRDKVTQFNEKPILNYYIGYAIFNKTAFDLIPPKVITMPDGDGLVTFFKILIALEKLGMYYHSGKQITFNTRSELVKAKDQFIGFFTYGKEENE